MLSLQLRIFLRMLLVLSRLHVKSTTDTSIVGTLNAIPVSFPLNSGITFPTAFAAPVEDGIIFPPAARPPLQSF